MEQLIKTILTAYSMEGVKAEVVTIVVADGVARCTSPVQHSAARAKSLRNRILRLSPSSSAEVRFTRVIAGNASNTMHEVDVTSVCEATA